MFLAALLIFPFILAAAVYRLYKLPRMYVAGTLHLAKGGLAATSVLTAVAYIGLLGYTAHLLMAMAEVLVRGKPSISAWLSVAAELGGYPVVYMAAEWVFYYGFKKPPKHAG